MSKTEDQIKRIELILGKEDPEVSDSTLQTYLTYLKQQIEFPCELTGIEDFGWEEYYVFGPGDKKEYEQLKKTQASYTDRFNLISMLDEIDEEIGLLGKVQRISDKKKFTLPLADLKVTNKKSKNYQLLDDYSVWFVNYR